MSSRDYRVRNRLAAKHLKESVSSLVAEVREVRGKLKLAKLQLEEIEEVVAAIDHKPEQPVKPIRRLRELENQNAELKERLSQGKSIIDRLLSQIKYIEERK
jgi:predicted RNase H-like nuclease (RuvC/YqgF family)